MAEDHVCRWDPFGYAIRQCPTCHARKPQPGFECRVCKGLPEHPEPCHTSVCDACRALLGLKLYGDVEESEFWKQLAKSKLKPKGSTDGPA